MAPLVGSLNSVRRLGRGRAWAVWVFLTGALWVTPLLALTPRDELLRLVPDDVGLCGVVQDLRGHAKALLGSSFVGHFRKSPLGQAILSSPDVRKLVEAEKFLQDNFKIDWAHLRDDILGDAVVLAYWPGTPQREQGMILVRARDPVRLASVVSRLPEVLKQSGKATPPEIRKHDGTAYWYWREGERSSFTYLKGPILVVTHQEELLWRVIDLDRKASRTDEPLLARQLQRLGVDKALAALWINPRFFEAEIEKAAPRAGAEPFARQTVLTYWKALEGIALSAALPQEGLELGLAFLVDEKRLPALARKMLAQPSRPSQLWRCFPDSAMLTVVSRVDTVGLTEMLQSFLNDPAQKTLRQLVARNLNPVFGRDVLREVLPFLGPDWGFCVVAPPPREDPGLLPHVVGALQVRPTNKPPPLDRTLMTALNAFAVMAVLAYNNVNSDQIVIRTEIQDQVEVRYFADGKCLPAGFQPAFAVKDGYLVLASNPAAVRLFRVPAPAGAAQGTAAELLLVRLSLRELGRYVQARHDVLAAYIAEKDGVSKEEAARRLDGVLAAFELFDRLEISQQATPDRLAWTLRLRTAEPLR
jgi:hypothetical protein